MKFYLSLSILFTSQIGLAADNNCKAAYQAAEVAASAALAAAANVKSPKDKAELATLQDFIDKQGDTIFANQNMSKPIGFGEIERSLRGLKEGDYITITYRRDKGEMEKTYIRSLQSELADAEEQIKRINWDERSTPLSSRPVTVENQQSNLLGTQKTKVTMQYRYYDENHEPEKAYRGSKSKAHYEARIKEISGELADQKNITTTPGYKAFFKKNAGQQFITRSILVSADVLENTRPRYVNEKWPSNSSPITGEQYEYARYQFNDKELLYKILKQRAGNGYSITEINRIPAQTLLDRAKLNKIKGRGITGILLGAGFALEELIVAGVADALPCPKNGFVPQMSEAGAR